MCRISACLKEAKTTGLCPMHYARLRRTGSTDARPHSWPWEQRLWSRVDRQGPDECWLWTGTKHSDGYGSLQTGTGVPKFAHRLVWELTYGTIPGTIDHKCGNRLCCNIKHLRHTDRSGNATHRTVPNSNNTSGYRGVSKTRKGRWAAKVSYRYKAYSLGTYDTPEEAYAKVQEKLATFVIETF